MANANSKIDKSSTRKRVSVIDRGHDNTFNLKHFQVKQSLEEDTAGTRSEERNTSVKISSGSVLTDTGLLSDQLEEKTRIPPRELSNSALRLALSLFRVTFVGNVIVT